MRINLESFKQTLPYASELFGVYQPLIGWKSKLINKRVKKNKLDKYKKIANEIIPIDDPYSYIGNSDIPKIVNFNDEKSVQLLFEFDCCLSRLIIEAIIQNPLHRTSWGEIINNEKLSKQLDICKEVVEAYVTSNTVKSKACEPYLRKFKKPTFNQLMKKESALAGYFLWIAENDIMMLDEIFYRDSKVKKAVEKLVLNNPLLSFGENNLKAILSPIGIVHLFRQYFFEFATFLGTPVGHVWVSPGGTVELVEVNTKKTITEQSFISTTESTQRTESLTTTQDEISDAVKEENSNNTSFGFSTAAKYTVPTFEASANVSLNMDNSRTTSREVTHKHMRQQSEKLTSEIKKSFTTTFKTTLQVEDTSSRRYVIQNTTDQLVNYELRRKMRQVGVQVQDIATQLCWQTYVDNPGNTLGISKLIHIAEPADLTTLTPPNQIQQLPPKQVSYLVEFPINSADPGHDPERDVVYTNGSDGETGWLNPDYNDLIIWSGDLDIEVPEGYTQGNAEVVTVPGYDVDVVVDRIDISVRKVFYRVPRVDFHGGSLTKFQININWLGTTLTEEQQRQNDLLMNNYNADLARRQRTAYIETAKERVKLASSISPRPVEELREEERTIVYRNLIYSLMGVRDGESIHVTSELIREIFDVEKMLYFVAPEWWRPRFHSHQNLSVTRDTITSIASDSSISWGGAEATRYDNYYITEDSAPAKMGSSLGWLLQLDGDNLRNAFLNSPWVKAIIPIRIGKEEAALQWLQRAEVEGFDGLDALYDSPIDELNEIKTRLKSQDGSLAGITVVTLRDAIRYLAQKVKELYDEANTPAVSDIDPATDPSLQKNVLPTEKVYEHGFYPLQGGFELAAEPFKVFSQWVEILPTDQVVALEYFPEEHL